MAGRIGLRAFPGGLARRIPRMHGDIFCAALLVAVLIALSTVTAWAQVNIIDLHHNTSSGVPASPYTIGTAVTVCGVVTVGVGTFTWDYTDVYLQDATAGVAIYQVGAPPYQFQIGDSVTISGTIAQYRGLTEVTMTGYTLHASGIQVPSPLVVTCDDVEHAFLPNYTEPNEGRLVRLNNVTWTGAWPSFSGGVTLQDASGTCTMFIDGTTDIQSMTPPSGQFDVVGIIKQYAGYAPPYTTGYEFMPRSPSDFYIQPGPQITAGPIETDIQSSQVTIHVETDYSTTIEIEYGETTSYELGTATDGLDATSHDVVLSPVAPATIHHYRVTAINEGGQTTTGDKLFCSASAPGGTGTIRAIFNKSVDHDLATYEQALGGQNLEGWIIDRINAANYSIDIAMYSFDLSAVADAIIAAKNRGLRIRFVYDNRNPYQAQVTRLINAGVVVINDAFGPNDGAEIMHDKLWIFDALSPNPEDPWVVTGSWNLSSQGTYTDAQNVIFFQDQALARVATFEFDEMWGSSTAVPNTAFSKFGINKTDNTPKLFNVGGRLVEMYFAPSDPWLQADIRQVEEADHSVHFSIMSYTRFDLCNEMELRWLNVPGMEIRGVFDSSESGNDDSQYHPMHGDGEYAWSPPADVLLGTETGILHHKYMILDVDRGSSDPVVITGSANWSNAACGENDENVVIVHDPVIANCYFQEFGARYVAAGGTGHLGAGVNEDAAANLFLFVEPNPAISSLEAMFSMAVPGRVVCNLYSVDGRLADRLVDRVFAAGDHRLRWEEERARALPAGTYFLRLQTPEGALTRRVTLVR